VVKQKKGVQQTGVKHGLRVYFSAFRNIES